MTTPSERTRAVIELAKEAMLLAPYAHGKSVHVSVPRERLRTLLAWLRHYPTEADLNMTASCAPHLWSARMSADGGEDIQL